MIPVIRNRFTLEADHSVYVAMSGGVDSSMAAALLKKKVGPFYAYLTDIRATTCLESS